MAEEFIPFASRPEWADVTPLAQDEGPAPAVRIAYTPQFEETMGYLRAVLAADERSQRALELTEEVIELNAGNYTCWHFRRQCLAALEADLEAELAYATAVGLENPKNYQIAAHLQFVTEAAGSPDKAMAFTSSVLGDDGKNYHAWALRQWCIASFDLWENEREFVDALLDVDVRNNSAWNQMFFVWTKNGTASPEDKGTALPELIETALTRIGRAPNNESPWNFLYGILEHALDNAVPDAMSTATGAVARVADLASSFIVSTPLRVFLVRAYSTLLPHDPTHLKTARDMAHTLATSLDTIRAKYWTYRIAQIDLLLLQSS